VREGEYLPDLPLLVTEGALKAEAFVSLRPPMRAFATVGVSVAHAEIIRALRGCDAIIGFDSDYRKNSQVCRQLGKLIAERAQEVLLSGYKNNTSIVVWDGAKGIDDAALQNVRLRVISIKEWSLTLTDKSKETVNEIWKDLSFAPDLE
jgi:hypothetical protein